MRVAAFYDIHGNLPALSAVLADAARERVDKFVFGGDVAAGPLPDETLDQLTVLAERARFVCGNADRAVVDAYGGRRIELTEIDDPGRRSAFFAASRISLKHRDFLAAFAPTVRLDIHGLGPTLFCHGSPRSDTEIITRITSEGRLHEILREVQEPVIVCGHTHQQFDRSIDGWRVINAGSVGVPYEGNPGAYWCLLGPDVQLRRTEYDIEQAVEQLRAGGFPDVDEMLKESLLEPIEPAAVSEFFERQALGER